MNTLKYHLTNGKIEYHTTPCLNHFYGNDDKIYISSVKSFNRNDIFGMTYSLSSLSYHHGGIKRLPTVLKWFSEVIKASTLGHYISLDDGYAVYSFHLDSRLTEAITLCSVLRLAQEFYPVVERVYNEKVTCIPDLTLALISNLASSGNHTVFQPLHILGAQFSDEVASSNVINSMVKGKDLLSGDETKFKLPKDILTEIYDIDVPEKIQKEMFLEKDIDNLIPFFIEGYWKGAYYA